MKAHFIQYKNVIFQLEQVVSVKRHELSPEDAKFFGNAAVTIELSMTNGQAVIFVNEEAEQVWGLLKASALNITPKS